MSEKKKFLIIDGSALLHRAFHALPPLTAMGGVVVNAVYGFTSVLLKILKELKPDYAAVTFDLAAPTFRHKEFKEYKAKRVKQPQELYDQIPLIEEVLDSFKIPVFAKEGFEADDVIATLCKQVEEKDKDVENIILTGDLDTLQLVSQQTKVLTFLRGISETVLYDREKVRERFGLEPEQMVDYKALRGDPSDNIPGVKGIGEVTAKDLVKRFGSVEGIYANLEKGEIKSKTKEILRTSKETALEAKRLVTLVSNVPTDFNLKNSALRGYDMEKISEVFQKFNFKSLLKRLPESEGTAPPSPGFGETGQKKNLILPKEKKKSAALEKKDLPKIINRIKQSKVLYFKTVFERGSGDSLSEKARELLLNVNGKIYKIDLTAKKTIDEIVFVFKEKDILKVGYDIKKEIHRLGNAGICVKDNLWDILIAAYLLSPGERSYSLENIILQEFGQTVSGEDAEHVKYFPQIYEIFSKKIKDDGLEFVLREIEMPLAPTLARMEKTGVFLNKTVLEKIKKEVWKEIGFLEQKIYKSAGEKFNINSPKQMKVVLFEKLNLGAKIRLRRTKTGVSTAAPELLKMRGLHPIINFILEYRELFKLYSTYLDALPKLINPKTKRLHAQFNQTVTATGRLSSSEPNLQNIPIRSEVGAKIRQAFVADKNFMILSVDYSQIELRVVAHLADDQNMIKAFNCREDIHIHTAAAVLGIAEKDVTSQMRRFAKTVNFGIIYGMGPQALAESSGMSYHEAQDFIDQYFVFYKGIRRFLDETKALVRSLGYAATLFGRRRYLPEISSGIGQLRALAERMAINHPVQGTAADLMKMAMIEIDKEIKNQKWEDEVKMILQVHDELVFEVRKDLLKKAAKMIREKMETVYKLRAPLEAEARVGKNWGELKKIKNKT